MRNNVFIAVLSFCFYTISISAYSQNQNVKFDKINAAGTISQSYAVCMLQDKKGFMWIGTRDGLYKYDGYNFTVYRADPEDPYSLTINSIKSIVEDKQGNIIIGTWGGGINILDREKDKFIHFKNEHNNPQSLSDNFINKIYFDKEDNLWVCTENGGLNLFERKTRSFRKYSHNPLDGNSISSDNVRDILDDRQGNLWIGTGKGGLSVLNKTTGVFTTIRHNPEDKYSLSSDYIEYLFEDSKQRLWIGTFGGGLSLYTPDTKNFKRYQNDPNQINSLCNNRILCIAEDDDENIWIGTENGGLSILNPKEDTFNNYYHDPSDITSLNHNTIYSLFKDSKGNMWMGTFNGGLTLINRDGSKFKHYKFSRKANSLSNNNVLCIYEDSKKNLWIGTDGGGLNLFDRAQNKFIHIKHDTQNANSLAGNFVLTVWEDSRNNLWIGTWGNGVSKYNPRTQTFENFKHDPKEPTSLAHDNVWTIIEDKDKNIWLGTYGGGLSRFNPETNNFTNFTTDINDINSLSSNYIYFLFEDSNSDIWIGTDGGGLNLFDKHTYRFTRFQQDNANNSISNNSINCIFEDKNHNFWISTDRGLNYFDRKKNKFKAFYAKDGLPGEMVFGILNDEHENLWISSSRGLTKFNPEKLSFQNFTETDGLQHDQFKRLAYCKSHTGAFYFGGVNGFNEFYPDEVKDIRFDPPIVITDFKIFNKRVPIGESVSELASIEKHIDLIDEINLNYKQSTISFDFASLNYTYQEKKKYAYMLEGFDKGWNDAGTRNSASYTNLDPGAYIFKVRGLNNEGRWSDKIASISVFIEPPFWKTWWFKLFSALAVVLCLVSFYNIRMYAVEKQKTVLEKQVHERTMELQQANTALFDQKEEILSQREQIENLYIEMKDSIRAAENIQNSILPSTSYIKKFLPESFILNKPKDVVSGDFYWFDVSDDKIIVAVVDCTGHGVSGAFMSINGHHLLNQSIYPYRDLRASEILDRLHEGVVKELNQPDGRIKDGMDIALCVIDMDKQNLQFAGAKNPLYLLRENHIIQIKPDKSSIGISYKNKKVTYTNHHVPLQKDDSIYLFTDGFTDQIGEETGEKFMYPPFRELLVKIGNNDMNTQKELLNQTFNCWKGNGEQLDDVMILGFKV